MLNKKVHIIAVLCAVLLSMVYGFSAENIQSESIRIDILSKYIRQVKEQTIPSVTLFFPSSALCENRTDGTVFTCSRIEIRYKDSFTVFCDSRQLDMPCDISFSPDGSSDFFSVMIPGERTPRIYPNRGTLKISLQSAVVFIQEKMLRYARDSARSEYGELPPASEEALAALTMIIRARGMQHMQRPLHGAAVFCDLAHCQTYRGRMADLPDIDFTQVIDDASVKDGLFFSSSCGGETLSSAVFGGSNGSAGVKDIFVSSGQWLCSDASAQWRQSLSADVCASILGIKETGAGLAYVYDKSSSRVYISAGEKKVSFAAEDFRLKINRVKGWNFLKSNNYSLAADENGSLLFEGYGLGHGTGFCQKGAAALARMGFNRYEILEHYYPAMRFASVAESALPDPALSFCTFSIQSGEIGDISYPAMLKRRQPAGSFFKLITAAYVLSRRPDLATSYQYTCTGKSSSASIPKKCDKAEGHGTSDLSRAMPCSCNLYFSSLYAQIDPKDFRMFVRALCTEFNLTLRLPEARDEESFALLLAGLDFSATLSVNDGIALVRILASGTSENEYSSKGTFLFPLSCRKQMQEMLYNTFVFGTASESAEAGGADVWGKTSTVIFGSNSPHVYGSFLGGDGDRGIICIINRGYGFNAAKQGKIILQHHQPLR